MGTENGFKVVDLEAKQRRIDWDKYKYIADLKSVKKEFDSLKGIKVRQIQRFLDHRRQERWSKSN
jgi:hypothetical protein